MAILGVDVGGTFTDAVLLDGAELRTAKMPTARRQEESGRRGSGPRPKINLWRVRPIREGMSGPRVRLIIRLLRGVRDPQTNQPYLDPHIHPNGKFTPQVAAAVKAFQHDHHQPVNAVVDIHTIRALRGARRLQRKQEATNP